MKIWHLLEMAIQVLKNWLVFMLIGQHRLINPVDLGLQGWGRRSCVCVWAGVCVCVHVSRPSLSQILKLTVFVQLCTDITNFSLREIILKRENSLFNFARLAIAVQNILTMKSSCYN